MTTRRNSLALAVPVALIALLTVVAVAFAAGGGNESKRHLARHPAAFAWLHPAVVPADWTTVRLPGSAARLSAPASWEAAPGDPGTRTLVTRAPSGKIIGYLNATPRQGDENAADWAGFRVEHNRGEGDREVRRLASARDLHFRSATGSCVIDSYLTITGNRYREIACLVAGRSSTTVIVAAAPPSRWHSEGPLLRRAVNAFTT
ncbi:MAG TPA: hypothetical protein VHS74_12960 [Solirubrobacterales bacterium]|jgi:hypothetical protein|nr:hypothetical protein [Solirubrobacterales bacterium]